MLGFVYKTLFIFLSFICKEEILWLYFISFLRVQWLGKNLLYVQHFTTFFLSWAEEWIFFWVFWRQFPLNSTLTVQTLIISLRHDFHLEISKWDTFFPHFLYTYICYIFFKINSFYTSLHKAITNFLICQFLFSFFRPLSLFLWTAGYGLAYVADTANVVLVGLFLSRFNFFFVRFRPAQKIKFSLFSFCIKHQNLALVSKLAKQRRKINSQRFICLFFLPFAVWLALFSFNFQFQETQNPSLVANFFLPNWL